MNLAHAAAEKNIRSVVAKLDLWAFQAFWITEKDIKIVRKSSVCVQFLFNSFK